MASSGAKVLQLRAVEYARNHGVRIHCRSSFDPGPGTFVLGEDETMERPLVTAVTHSTEEARITLLGVPDRPGAAARIFGALATAGCIIDTIIQNEPLEDGRMAEVSFTVTKEDLNDAQVALSSVADDLGISKIDTDQQIGKVSIVGAGMRSHPGVAAKVFQTLAEENINIEMISTSPIKISCVIRSESVPQAVRALHAAFDLGAGGVAARRGPTMSAGLRVAVVGATGAVGTTMLELLRRREFPASEIVPFASERSRGREARRNARPRARRRRDRRLRHSAVLRRRDPLAPVGATVRRGWGDRDRQLFGVPARPRDPAGRLRGKPARARGPPRVDRQPQLLDHAADGRGRADPPRGRNRADDRGHLPVGVGHRDGGRRRARGPGPRLAARGRRLRRRRSIPSRSRST